jgi:hypothetical protein
MKEMKDTLKSAIENLVSQEIRLLQLGGAHTPSFVLEELSVSIKESKREVALLTQSLTQKERAILVKKMIRETVEEEIDRTVQHRGNPCLRCVHLRYYDWELNPHEKFPIGTNRARAIGCDRFQGVSRVRCERFIETPRSMSVVDYVDEMTLLYELREMFKKMRKIWEDYFLG